MSKEYTAKFRGATLAPDFTVVIKLQMNEIPEELRDSSLVFVSFEKAQLSIEEELEEL